MKLHAINSDVESFENQQPVSGSIIQSRRESRNGVELVEQSPASVSAEKLE